MDKLLERLSTTVVCPVQWALVLLQVSKFLQIRNKNCDRLLVIL